MPFNSVLAAEKTISQWEAELNKVQKELNETNILPQAFDPRVAEVVSTAVKALI
mgnify:CR=1 FL=1